MKSSRVYCKFSVRSRHFSKFNDPQYLGETENVVYPFGDKLNSGKRIIGKRKRGSRNMMLLTCEISQ